MPGDISYKSGTTYFGPNLVRAVESGQVPRARIDVSYNELYESYAVEQGSRTLLPVSWRPGMYQHAFNLTLYQQLD